MFRRKPPPPPSDRWLVIGLGNPGPQYAGTRHNLGFLIVDELAARHRTSISTRAAKSLTGRIQVGSREVIVAKPQTFMNESGAAAKALRDKYGVPLERTLVVHDELDLPFGRLRVRRDGSAAGHNGVKSLIDGYGTKNFIRFRIGVGRPVGSGMDYLLSPFTPEERAALPPIVAHAADAVIFALEHGLDRTMTEFNRG
ncbi:MAG TPA: aminoacyl-tRNA hydrolase [Candidatus Limnocylindrales bacterium]|nr:aminoacyl-tRNA hydrolase [Candidatus Limnocylindrales bacterium]